MQLFYSYLICIFCSQPIAKLPIRSTTYIFVIFVLVTFCYITNDPDLRYETPFDHGHGFSALGFGEDTVGTACSCSTMTKSVASRTLVPDSNTNDGGWNSLKILFFKMSDDWAGVALRLDSSGAVDQGTLLGLFYVAWNSHSLKQVPEMEHLRRSIQKDDSNSASLPGDQDEAGGPFVTLSWMSPSIAPATVY